MRLKPFLLAITLVIAGSSELHAQAIENALEEVTGEVVESRARWTQDRANIITESVVETDDGARYDLFQLGGTVDGIGMVQRPSEVIFGVGDLVRIQVVGAAAPAADNGAPLAPRQVYRVLEHTSAAQRLLPANARAYVRTTNPTMAELHWRDFNFSITLDDAGTSHLPGDSEFDLLDQAFRTWSDATVTCSELSFDTSRRAAVEVGNDRINVVKFREDRWCRPLEDNMEQCYAAEAAGITTLFFVNDTGSGSNGEIVDADIEFNAVNFRVSNDGDTDAGGNNCLSDVRNTGTHEVGHFLGLDHTCFTGGTRREDDEGNPVPDCIPIAALSSDLTEATMFNFQACGEIKKRTLEPGDIAGACAVTQPRGGGCCAVAGHGRASATPTTGELTLFAAVSLSLLVLFRRRRS